MAKKSVSRIFVWIILAMIIVGLIGFGSTNLGGTIRTIGKVGTKEISVTTYFRALQQELNALSAQFGEPIPFSQAQSLGLDQGVLAGVVSTTLLDAELARVGISVGDETLREQLLQIGSFQGIDGKFDRQAYTFAIENAGLNEREFEEQLRDEIARTMLQSALLSGAKTNDAFAQTFVAYMQETRDVTWAELNAADLAYPVAEPTDDDLRAHYDANIDTYTLPETRQITYVWLSPEMILDTVELDTQSLRDAYDRRSDEFNTPERRLVERLIYPDETSASEAMQRITDGTASFEELVAERGLELINIDMGDVTKAELGAAGDIVFAGQEPGIVGPAPTSLGPALFRVNAILSAQTVSFEDAQPALREELAYDRATRVIDAQVTDLEDLLAAGATLEELAADTEMQLGQIGYHPDVFDGIAGYAAFRELAQAVTVEDFPEIGNLADGGVFAIRLDAIDAPRPEEFDVVRESVADDLILQRQLAQLETQANEISTALAQGESFEALGLTGNQEAGVSRTSRIGGAPVAIISAIFELDEPGAVDVLTNSDSVTIVRLDATHATDMNADENTALLASINQQSSGAIDQEIFESFINAVRLRTEIELNQQAINAVHANFQ